MMNEQILKTPEEQPQQTTKKKKRPLLPLPEVPSPYEPAPGESVQHWTYFVFYRDMGPDRTVKRVAEVAGKRYDHLWRVARRYRWEERARIYDIDLDRRLREARAQAIEEMNQRHLMAARELLAKGLAALRQMDPKELGPSDLLRYILEAAKFERTVAGEPEKVEKHQFDWASAVIEAWRRYMREQAVDGAARGMPAPTDGQD